MGLMILRSTRAICLAWCRPLLSRIRYILFSLSLRLGHLNVNKITEWSGSSRFFNGERTCKSLWMWIHHHSPSADSTRRQTSWSRFYSSLLTRWSTFETHQQEKGLSHMIIIHLWIILPFSKIHSLRHNTHSNSWITQSKTHETHNIDSTHIYSSYRNSRSYYRSHRKEEFKVKSWPTISTFCPASCMLRYLVVRSCPMMLKWPNVCAECSSASVAP